MSKKIVIIIIIGIIFITGIVYTAFFNEKREIIKNINQKTVSCDDLAKIISQQKKINEIKGCNMKQYEVDGKALYLISVYYGGGMDCESGCIYQNYTGLIDQNTNIFDFSWNPPYDKINDYMKKYGRLCVFAPWKNTNPASAQNVEIVKINGSYSWKLAYDNFKIIRSESEEGETYYGKTGCTINGVALGTQYNIDTSKLEIAPVLIDCNEIKDATKLWLCWSDWAAVKNDLTICETYANNNYCYDNVANANFNIEACNDIVPSNILGYDPKSDCLNNVKNKRHW